MDAHDQGGGARGGGWRDALGMAALTVAFGALHSALASRAAKRLAAQLVGERARDGWYRTFYNVQAVATSVALVAYGRRHPGPTVWHVRGVGAALMRAGQAVGLALGVAAVRQLGLLRVSGLASVAAWGAGDPRPDVAPEAQGPRIDAAGHVPAPGPFAWTRHPLNVAPLPVLWLQPRMTTALLAFTAVATAYLVVGSWHEEARLAARHGEAYDAYRARGVPFYLPFHLSFHLPLSARRAPSAFPPSVPIG